METHIIARVLAEVTAIPFTIQFFGSFVTLTRVSMVAGGGRDNLILVHDKVFAKLIVSR